jgi:hypothetical protein
MAATFGGLLTQLRELDERLAQTDRLIDEVHYSATMRGGSLHKAYQRVMRERESPEEDFGGEEAGGADEAGPSESGWRGRSDEEMERELFEETLRAFMGIDPRSLAPGAYEKMYRNFRKSVLGDDGRGEEPKGKRRRGGDDADRFEPRADERPLAGAEPARPRLKELYRMLVRRLHPDMRADSDAKVSALWHEVQSAYQRGDEDRLETLLALCDLQADAVSSGTPLSQLQAVRAELKRNLGAMRRALAQMRKDPAWDFEHQDHEGLGRAMRRTIEGDIELLRKALQENEALIESWKVTAARRPKVRAAGRGRRAAVESFWQEDLPL